MFVNNPEQKRLCLRFQEDRLDKQAKGSDYFLSLSLAPFLGFNFGCFSF